MGSKSNAEGLLAARGTLFDGLAALGNLQQLVSSVRVAPRGLQELLPEAAQWCRLLPRSVTEFCDAARSLAGPRASIEALDHLADFSRSTLDQVAIELQNATRDLSANPRLDLELRLGRRTQALAAAFGLVDLIAEALVGRRTTVELRELLRQAGSPGDATSQGMTLCHLQLSAPESPLLVHTNAMSAIALMGLATGWLCRHSDADLLLEVEYPSPDHLALRFSRNDNLRESSTVNFSILRSPWIRITPVCMRFAAELSEAELVSDGPRALTICWPEPGLI